MDLQAQSQVLPSITPGGPGQFNIVLLDIDIKSCHIFIFKIRPCETQAFFGTPQDITTGIVYQTIMETEPSFDAIAVEQCVYTMIIGACLG